MLNDKLYTCTIEDVNEFGRYMVTNHVIPMGDRVILHTTWGNPANEQRFLNRPSVTSY